MMGVESRVRRMFSWWVGGLPGCQGKALLGGGDPQLPYWGYSLHVPCWNPGQSLLPAARTTIWRELPPRILIPNRCP